MESGNWIFSLESAHNNIYDHKNILGWFSQLLIMAIPNTYKNSRIILWTHMYNILTMLNNSQYQYLSLHFSARLFWNKSQEIILFLPIKFQCVSKNISLRFNHSTLSNLTSPYYTESTFSWLFNFFFFFTVGSSQSISK